MRSEDDPLTPADLLLRYLTALAQVARPPPQRGKDSLPLLPLLTCLAAGGQPQRALPLAVAWHLLRLASGLLDHAQDGDPLPGVGSDPQAINLATGLLFAAQLVLARLPLHGVSQQRTLALMADFNATALRACAGQHQDLTCDQLNLEACRQALALRAGEPFALAARAGGAVATDDLHLIALCHEFGYNLGVLWQLADDFDDLWNPRGPSDLALGRRTLPVVYALTVAEPPERDCLEALLHRAAAGDGAAEAAARQLITAHGAALYLVTQAQVHRGRAETALRELGGSSAVRAHLRALLDRAMPALAAENHGQAVSRGFPEA